ncbi:MAG: hypothetical protein JNL01_00500 [Bdellovibrionales bacterium]|nr:hypothetical protein [Bdellovibrionales bacterium]
MKSKSKKVQKYSLGTRILTAFLAVVLTLALLEAYCRVFSPAPIKNKFRFSFSKKEALVSKSSLNLDLKLPAEIPDHLNIPVGVPVKSHLLGATVDPIQNLRTGFPVERIEQMTRVLEDGRILFDVKMKKGKDGFRITPSSGMGEPQYYALFFGCSFAFGEGVQDHQTLPYYFQQLGEGKLGTPVRSKNYAHSAWGTAQFWKVVHEVPPPAAILEAPQRIAFYVMIDHHFERLRGAYSIARDYPDWVGNTPYIAEDWTGQIVDRGYFRDSFKLALFRFLSGSKLFYTMNLGPAAWEVTDSELEFFSKVVASAQQKLKADWKVDEFYTVVLPQNDKGHAAVPYLNRLGVKTLDLSKFDLQARMKVPAYLPDRHPSAEGQRYLAGILLDAVRRDLK